MRRRLAPLLIGLGLFASGCGDAADPAPASSPVPAPVPAAGPVTAMPSAVAAAIDPAGTYQRDTPSKGQLVIAAEGEQWRLGFAVAGLPAGPAMAADCILVAAGPLQGDRVIGRLVPFDGPDGGLDARDIGPNPGEITAVLSADGATISETDASSRHCGVGSGLTGVYRKVS